MNFWKKTKENGNMKTMKKLWMAVAWTAAFVLASCQEESFEGRDGSDNYYASVETFGTGTKTELGEGRSVIWSLEDRIAIFEGSGTGQAYQVLDSYIGKSSGEFEEVEGLVAEGIGASLEGTIAVYPFTEDLSVTSGANGDYIIEGISFPSEQKYIAGSFSDEAFPMTAVCKNGSRNLSFKNIGGVLKLSLTGNYSVSQITLTGNSGEPLSGSATVTLGSDGIPSVTMSDDASTSVNLVCDPAVQLDPETATDFYISIPPTDFEAGFKVTILDGEGKEHGLATHKTNPAERSSILAMPESTPESMDDIELTADTFCSVDFVEGWTETRFGGDGTIIFIKEDDMGRMTHSLMLLPNDETVLMPVYIRFDEKEVPSYMSFMNTEIYINGYTDSTVDFTLAVEDAVWSVKDVPCNELQFFSPTTRSWKDNNGIRNVCALGNIIVGSVDVVLGAVLIGGSLIIEGGSVGLATPAAVPTIAAAIIEIGSGLNTIYDGSNTLFGPADQKRDSYATAMFVNGGLEVLSEFLQSMEVTGNEIIVKFPRELDTKGKVGLASFILGMGFTTIDELWGETYTGPVNLAQVHQEVNVVTGRADNITKDSAELYGYVSPVATAPFGDRIITEIYIVVWKAGDENNKQNRSIFNSDGGIVSFTFTGLEPDTEYCYQTIFEDLDNKIYRFGEVNTFKTKGDDCTLREQLIKLYNDTDGDNWTNNENWCSDKPIEEWYGINKLYNEDYYEIYLYNNNLVGTAELNCSEIYLIDVYNNQLSSLDLSGCTSLTELSCSDNQLTSLNLSGCTALTGLGCSNNQLSSLDLSGCASLEDLDCDGNQLSSLDLSGLSALTEVSFYDNPLQTINLSGCTSLTELSYRNNQLTALDLSGCASLEDLDCENNQLTSLDISGCTALERVDCCENQLTSLDVSGCTALTELVCSDNQLTSLDVSGCASLEDLDCNGNQLTALDLSGCASLEDLDCENNQLTSLDISGCTALTELSCSYNQMISLDISGHTALEDLYCCPNHHLTSLNISGCTALRRFEYYDGQLTSLDVSGCTALTELVCIDGQLTSLDISGCTALTKLSCTDNQLTSLDVSGCTALTVLGCSYNQLTSLDVSRCTALTELSCSDNQLTSLDISGCTALSWLDCSDNQLTSLNISEYAALRILFCENNQLTSLDVSGCTSLKSIYCESNQLTSLDASGCTALERVDCCENPLESINLSGCSTYNLPFHLHIPKGISSFDLSGCTALESANLKDYQLTSLNVSGCTALTELDCSDNQLTSLNVSGCTSLKYLRCKNNLISQEITPEYYDLWLFEYDRRYTSDHKWYYDKDGNKVGCDFSYTDYKIGWWHPGEPESMHSEYH